MVNDVNFNYMDQLEQLEHQLILDSYQSSENNVAAVTSRKFFFETRCFKNFLNAIFLESYKNQFSPDEQLEQYFLHDSNVFNELNIDYQSQLDQLEQILSRDITSVDENIEPISLRK